MNRKGKVKYPNADKHTFPESLFLIAIIIDVDFEQRLG
jgi:hypothetical protein